MSNGERRLQELWGTTGKARAFERKQVLDRLNTRMREFVACQELVLLGTADAEGACDCTFRGGPPGFVRVLDARRLLLPEYRGNGVYASLGNVQENPHVGCLFIDFVEAGVGLHVNGRARIVEPQELDPSERPDDPRAERWLLIEVEEAYIHCAKHIPRFQRVPGRIEWGADDESKKRGDYFNARPSRRGQETRAPLPAAGVTALSARARGAWRAAQAATWAAGVALLAALLLRPALGLHALWNVLIPLAPALLVLAPGLWRNICPLGTTSLLPRHLRLTRRLRLPAPAQERLALAGVLLLLALVPLRHVVLDTSGPATALALLLLALTALLLGACCEWKSGWCSGLCPVHPVERLYGSRPLASPPNAHCTRCERCVSLCPESKQGLHPLTGARGARALAGTLIAGGFAGFVWGWFQVPDYAAGEGWRHLGTAYGWPLLAGALSLALFLALRGLLDRRHEDRLIRCFAAVAIACYYWYRVPALAGFGPFPGDGMLVDLRGVLPGWTVWLSRSATTLFFVWWLAGRPGIRRSWSVRPPMALPQVRQETGRVA